VQSVIQRRIAKFVSTDFTDLHHRAKIVVPKPIRDIIRACPKLIPKAIQSFLQQTPGDLAKAIEFPLTREQSSEFAEIVVKFSRIQLL